MKEKKENLSPADSAGEGSSEERKRKANGSGGSPLRVVVLVLLLVIAAAAGLLSYLGQIQPVGAPPKGAEKHRIAIPRPGSPAAAPSEEKIETVRIESPPIAVPVPPQPDQTPAPAGKTETPPVAQAQSAPPPSSSPPAASPQARPAPRGEFSLETGPLILRSELAGAEKTLRRLGFEPKRISARQEITLVRLREGVYPPVEAQARLAELSAAVPSAFSLPQGDRVAVYAGSYYDIDKARSFADVLYGKGIRLEEEQAQVTIAVQRLRFGSFADRAAALRGAEKAAAAGVEASVVRSR